VLQHDGCDDGFLSNLRLWTESGIGIVTLCNAMWGELEDVADAIYKIVVDGK